MKKTILLIISMLLLSSCEKLAMPEESVSSSKQKVSILTRSSTEDIQYPMSVYAFSEEGKCIAQQTISSSSENLSLSLSKGKYHLVALSNTSGYIIPSSPSYTSIVSMASDDNQASTPLQMGQADISVGEANQNVNIILSYKVAHISFVLNNVPSDITDVNVTVSQPNSCISLSCAYSNPKTTTVKLIKSSTSWVATNVYVFPSESSSTTFTLTLTGADGTTSYGYTYNAHLTASTPYNIVGNYTDDNIELTGTFTSKGWEENIDLCFNFGPEGNGNNNDDENIQTFFVTSYPVSGTLFDGHIVAYTFHDEAPDYVIDDASTLISSYIDALLLSKEVWQDVASAYSENSPEQAFTLASQYIEDSITSWTIPTSQQAKALKSLYSGTKLETLNTLLESNSITPIKNIDDVRYLCEDATYSFDWDTSSKVTKAGSKKGYNLRLVKHVRFVKK